uniref:Uncharacterized protein n=1 Tax=Physcomitrium patens TaxID=3218 RepID=A0A2K1KCX9_PHYPA|nr:hypothetical protein PHYPA_010824 [Physcomitrium patens]
MCVCDCIGCPFILSRCCNQNFLFSAINGWHRSWYCLVRDHWRWDAADFGFDQGIGFLAFYQCTCAVYNGLWLLLFPLFLRIEASSR